MSSGVTRVGVTRDGNYMGVTLVFFFLKKLTAFLLIASESDDLSIAVVSSPL